MCSLSWCRYPDGYEVFFNRDERKTRGRALPPSESIKDGIRYLAPRDTDAGGTWLLANEFGLTLGLLNYGTARPLPQPPAAAQSQSRGQWLLQWACLADAFQLAEALKDHVPWGCGLFTLVAFDRHQQAAPQAWRWNGTDLRSFRAGLPLCSSSYAPAQVISSRQASFAGLRNHGAEALWRWHSKEDHPSAESARMLRTDAQTWCVSRISVGASQAHWLYREEMPELAAPPIDHQSDLPLRLAPEISKRADTAR